MLEYWMGVDCIEFQLIRESRSGPGCAVRTNRLDLIGTRYADSSE